MVMISVDLDDLISARDAMEDAGYEDELAAGVTRFLRAAVDSAYGRVWCALNTTTNRAIETVGQEAAEQLVASMGDPWVLAIRADQTGGRLERIT